jgi:hypothetical protein
VAGVAGWGGLLAFSLPLFGVAVLEIGGDGREEVFAGYGAVLVELGEAKKWLWEGVEVGTGTGWPRGTLALVAGGGHLWWDGSRAWQGRQWFWRS